MCAIIPFTVCIIVLHALRLPSSRSRGCNLQYLYTHCPSLIHAPCQSTTLTDSISVSNLAPRYLALSGYPVCLALSHSCAPVCLALSHSCAPACLALSHSCAPACLAMSHSCAPACLALSRSCAPACLALSHSCTPACLAVPRCSIPR